ncbi:MAG: UDP-N-acetylmuramoyl-tripeptide--D-alanyl-D-alanine ligase [Armatimonadota bacterium]|nr:UDP-N-acetylmuramoyl-tripeptide--D-alanyl-D-alanine ligase [Armatimonadota bacterium]
MPDVVLTVAEVAAATGGRLVRADPHAAVASVVTDSRQVRPGALFAALAGPHHDGHAFVADAARRGAVAAVVSRPVEVDVAQVVVDDVLACLLPLAAAWIARFDVRAVGVTGSTGKTTTVRMIESVLQRAAPTHASQPNWNAEVGVPLTVFGLRRDHRYLVVEMAMRGAGQIAQLCRAVRPAVGVVTNVGESHLALLGSIEAIARAKAELVDALPPDGAAVLNADDPRVAAMDVRCRGRVVRYGLATAADVHATDVRIDAEGCRFRLAAGADTAAVHLPVPGQHFVSNALAAAAVGVVEGVSVGAIADALSGFRPPPGRLQLRRLGGDVVVCDDTYNASPASLRAALETARALRGGRRLVAVLGEMRELGPRADAAHQEAGALCAAEGVDALVVVGELGSRIAQGARAAGMRSGAIHASADAADAARLAAELVRDGDLVLVKGSRAVGLERVVAGLASARSSAAVPTEGR